MSKLILFISFLTSTVCFSQQVTFEHLTQNEGLPSPTVTCLDEKGLKYEVHSSASGAHMVDV